MRNKFAVLNEGFRVKCVDHVALEDMLGAHRPWAIEQVPPPVRLELPRGHPVRGATVTVLNASDAPVLIFDEAWLLGGMIAGERATFRWKPIRDRRLLLCTTR